MLKTIPEFSVHVLITGLKSIRNAQHLVKLINEQKTSSIEMQVLNADHVATWQHLYFAVLNALAVFENGSNISRSLAVETLLYASAQHQIRKATQLMGIHSKTNNAALVIIGKDPVVLSMALSRLKKLASLQEDDHLLELTAAKKRKIQRLFHISETELATTSRNRSEEAVLTDMIIERMAMLSVET